MLLTNVFIINVILPKILQMVMKVAFPSINLHSKFNSIHLCITVVHIMIKNKTGEAVKSTG